MTWVFLATQPTLQQSLDMAYNDLLAWSHPTGTVEGKTTPCLECAQPSYGSNPSPWTLSGSLCWLASFALSKLVTGPLREGARPQKWIQSQHYTAEPCFLMLSRAKYKQISNIRIPFLFQYTSAQLQKGKELRCIFFWHSSLGTME